MIGQRIKEIRNNNSLTQEELADGIISRTYLSLIEKGSVHPSTNVLIKLSERLNCSINDFMTEVSQFKYNDVEVLREIVHYEHKIRKNDFENIERFIEKEYEKLEDIPAADCGRIHLIYAQYYYSIQRMDKVSHHIDESIDKLASIAYNQTHIDAVELKAEILIENKDYIEALDLLEEVLSEVVRSKDMSLEVIKLLHIISKCYYLIGEFITSKRLIERLEKQSMMIHIDYKKDERTLLKAKTLTQLKNYQEVLRLTRTGQKDIQLYICYSAYKLGKIQDSVACFKELNINIDESAPDNLSKTLYRELEDKLEGLINQ